MTPTVEIEELLAPFEMPNNNTFPLWCYGAPVITRDGEHVYATIPAVDPTVPPMCNTRPQLFRKTGGGPWQRVFVNPLTDQREPCPLANLGAGGVVLSLNSAVTPFREGEGGSYRMWYCEPYLLRFEPGAPEGSFPELLKPQWDEDWPFTDHSYRGLAADPARQALFVMHIEGYQWKPGPQGRYHWALRGADGGWPRQGLLEFPLRCCYPCVSLRGGRVDVLAISDVDEPNPEWMAYKRDFAGVAYDFDFRKLYYTWAADITRGGFAPAVLVEDAEITHGHIRHFDLHVGEDGTAHALYLVRNISKPYLRDRFWPGQGITARLVAAQIRGGQVTGKQVIAECREDPAGNLWSHGLPAGEKHTGDSFRTADPMPLHAAFHAAPGERLTVLACLGGHTLDGQDLARNVLFDLTAGPPAELTLRDPFKTFFTAPPRNGSTPSDRIDVYGIGKHSPDQIRYARIRADA